MKVTRRQALILASAGAPALAQAPASNPPASPDEELRRAREQVARAAEALEQYELPMSTEPAFVFKAT
ncbi:MAG: hypothetical protein IRZ15_07615 [Bryobacteraceae bacterium]|nr:hypothetical protein [Bryobacteraceae bacterium]